MDAINAELRGKEEKVDKLREEGILPAVVYGPKGVAVSIKMPKEEFDKLLESAGESTLVNLKIEGKDTSVLIHDLQRDINSRGVTHVDFYEPSLKEKTNAHVALVFEGESFAIKNLSGTLVKSFHEIEVSALPQNLPHEIVIDISSLKALGDIITVKDLNIPEGVEVVKLHENDAIASIAAAKDVDKDLEAPIDDKAEEETEEESEEEGKEDEEGGEEKKPEGKEGSEKPKDNK
jgi:large subunit ribosomal protein L25